MGMSFETEIVRGQQVGCWWGLDQIGAVSTWCNRLGAYQVGAKKHIFLHEFGNFFSQPKFYLINEVQFRKRIIFIINEVGR